MKNAIICTVLLLFSFGSVVAQQQNLKGSEGDLSQWIGDGTDKLLDEPGIKSRLIKLLGKKNYQRFTDSFETQGVIERHENFIFAKGCMIHACSKLESAIAIDIVNQTVHAAIFNSEKKTKFFNENKTETPRSIIEWAGRLETLIESEKKDIN